jgi:hypothetical protein
MELENRGRAWRVQMETEKAGRDGKRAKEIEPGLKVPE